MKQLLTVLEAQAKQHPQRIVYPESTEPRILKAVYQVAKQGLAHPLLLGKKETILAVARNLGLSDLFLESHVKIINPAEETALREVFAEKLFTLRKKKGMTPSLARKLMQDPLYFATMLVYSGDADGVISGAIHPTAHTFRPALQILRTNKKQRMSAFFLMKHGQEFYLFADCSVNITPSEQELAEIAVLTVQSAQTLFGLRATIAMLSFSTHGSTDHPLAEKMRKATAIARKLLKKYKMHDVKIDGELQADAALIPEIHAIKAHGASKDHIHGRANILIFPNLESANIAYKLVEWLGHYEAIGPITQGLGAAMNDLSRGCTVSDIVEVTAITAVQAQLYKQQKQHKGRTA